MEDGLAMVRLTGVFNEAKGLGMSFIAVKIRMDGFPEDEVIINGHANIETKLDYYKKTYDENLKHRFAPGISIVDYTYGDSYDDIQDDLID